MNRVFEVNTAGVLKSTSIYKLVATLRTSCGFSRDIRPAAWTLDKLRVGWCWRNNCVCDWLDTNAPNWNLNHLFARWAINQLRRHFLRRINRLTALRALKMDVWHKNVRSHLTKKAEPPPTRDANRDSGTESANGGWLRRLVRPLAHNSIQSSRKNAHKIGANLRERFRLARSQSNLKVLHG